MGDAGSAFNDRADDGGINQTKATGDFIPPCTKRCDDNVHGDCSFQQAKDIRKHIMREMEFDI